MAWGLTAVGMLSHAGDVATWSGVVTGGLMLLSPLLFERLGWRGVAGATPKILLYGGSAFFAACIVYQVGGRGGCGGHLPCCAILSMLLIVGVIEYEPFAGSNTSKGLKGCGGS